MLSKWKLWDFFKANPTGLSPEKKGVYAVRAFDPVVMKLFKDQVPKEYLEEGKFNIMLGKEVTSSWIEENLRTLGLFGNSESYLIHNAQEMPKDAKAALLDEGLIVDDRYIVLSFSSSDDFFSELSAKEDVNGIEITPPMFWETREFLEFFSSYTGVYLDYQAGQRLQEAVEPTCSNYLNILEQLKINFGNESIDLHKLNQIVKQEKLDQFLLAELFGSKKFSGFYKRLLETNLDNISLLRFFAFMQKHMGKICDPSYLDSKKKLSKYDRQILSCSKIWKKSDALRSIDYFKNLEVEAKLSKPMLVQKIRRDYLKSF